MRLTLLLSLAVAAAASPALNVTLTNNLVGVTTVRVTGAGLRVEATLGADNEAWRELAAEGLPNVAGMPVPVTSWRFLLKTLRQMQSAGALDEDEEDCVLAAIVHILNNDPNEEPLISRVDGVLRRFTDWMDEDRF